jgi:hypothetical protein
MTQANTTTGGAEAIALWEHVFGDERGLLHVWTGRRGPDGEIPNRTIDENFFNYPGATETAAQWALEKSAEGREVYFCTHLLTAAKRAKGNASAVLALWADLDGTPLPNSELIPTAVVESSPEHYHPYWRLTDPIPPEVAERLNKRLAREIGADPSGFDLTQLLRVPGTANHKYADRPPVRIIEMNSARAYSPAELDELLPELERPQGDPEPEGPTEAEPPVVLDEEAMKVWRGEKPKLKDDGVMDTSASLVKIGRVLYDAGANRGVVIDALRERDAALGWRKYSDRNDAETRYAEIFYELQRNGRPDRSRSRSRIDRDRDDSGIKNPKGSLRAVSFKGKERPPRRQFVVDGWIPTRVPTLVYGPSGIAKSFNVLHLCLSVAFVGVEEWHGLQIATMPVIYLDFEMEHDEQLRRAKEVATGAGWPDLPANFWYVNAVGHSSDDVFNFTVEQLSELDEALVAVDSFGFAHAGESERSSDVLAFMRQHIGALQAAGGHPLIVDHVARLVRGERASNQDAFGSIYKKNAARSNIHVTGHQEEGSSQVYTTFTHRNCNVGPLAAPFTVITKFAAEEVTFELSDEVIRPPAPESTAELVVAAITEHGPMTNKEIATTIGRALGTVQNTTKELKDSGVLVPTGEKRDGAPVLGLEGSE